MHRKEMAFNKKKVKFYQAWQDSLKTYKAVLRTTKSSYYSSLIEENKKSRFLFSTVAWLTQSHNSIEQSIPPHLSSSDFMNFF